MAASVGRGQVVHPAFVIDSSWRIVRSYYGPEYGIWSAKNAGARSAYVSDEWSLREMEFTACRCAAKV